MAPELQKLGDVTYDEKIDIFSLGVVLFEYATKELPFTNNDQLLNKSPKKSLDQAPIDDSLKTLIYKHVIRKSAKSTVFGRKIEG